MNTQRRGRKVETGPRAINQLPWKQPQLTLEPSRILSDDQLETIHNESLRVLEEIGMDMIYAEAAKFWPMPAPSWRATGSASAATLSRRR